MIDKPKKPSDLYTGIFVDKAVGDFTTEVIYDDTNPDQIEAIAPTQPHRNVDLEILKADSEGE